jgi:hypothetical protein
MGSSTPLGLANIYGTWMTEQTIQRMLDMAYNGMFNLAQDVENNLETARTTAETGNTVAE